MNRSFIFGVIGLVFGVSLTSIIFFSISNVGKSMPHTQIDDPVTQSAFEASRSENQSHDHMAGEQMTLSLTEKTGDEFDKAFIEGMIEHHQGAIDMANLSPKNAKHEEIKQLSREIIAAQENEINLMKKWLVEWNY